VSNVEHLFDSISAKFILDKWQMDWKKAVWLSSLNSVLAIVLSPMVGHLLDRVNNRMTIASLACAAMAAAHCILGFLPWTPLVGMLTLAVAQSVLPTIIRSSVPCVVPHAVAGVAFGMYSVAENVGKVVGNPLVGYLKDETGQFRLDTVIFVSMSGASVLLCIAIAVLDGRQGRTLRRRPSADVTAGGADEVPPTPDSLARLGAL
jgi:MFS-type transporter involved in bile tolerance (Atg22 family)